MALVCWDWRAVTGPTCRSRRTVSSPVFRRRRAVTAPVCKSRRTVVARVSLYVAAGGLTAPVCRSGRTATASMQTKSKHLPLKKYATNPVTYFLVGRRTSISNQAGRQKDKIVWREDCKARALGLRERPSPPQQRGGHVQTGAPQHMSNWPGHLFLGWQRDFGLVVSVVEFQIFFRAAGSCVFLSESRDLGYEEQVALIGGQICAVATQEMSNRTFT